VVVFASVGPPQYVPHIFFSYHIEHFVAFYLVAVLAAAGLPTIRLQQIACALVLTSLILATVRFMIPRHRLTDAEDLAADLSGIAAAVAPVFVGRFRQVAAQRPNA
jgi:hypothetical protein